MLIGFIWGWDTRTLGTKQLNAECPACKNDGLFLIGTQTVFEIFLIPNIPLGKSSYIGCDACGATYPTKMFDLSDGDMEFKTPKRYFSGLILVAVIVGLVSSIIILSKRREASFKESPTVGKYFTFRLSDPYYKTTPYAFAEITDIKGDKISVRFSQRVYSHEQYAVQEAQSAQKNPNEFLDSRSSKVTKDAFKKIKVESIVPDYSQPT